ncbi:MAG: zinc-dependent peptidase [Gammaproteobacteria bacterium]|nr:zinc-dependent peptidase [Gammaproteobacteria bacterium]MCY4282279.1 zinc-dependent peptidase [Gammaproteobacteria bacterium]
MWRRRKSISDAAWAAALDAVPMLAPLADAERAQLRELSACFIASKSIEPVRGQRLDTADLVMLAAQACLPVLALGLEAYASWQSVVVYPGGFVAREREVDEAGVEHEWDEARAGESWPQGPVILSWEDVLASGQGEGYNVVVHEMAHKLDMLDGEANGRPPLHRDMDAEIWRRDFSAAFADLKRRIDAGEAPAIDDYATTDPSEFFAVTSEYFFDAPGVLANEYPAVYTRLCEFYRQRPRPRFERLKAVHR